MGLLSAHDYNEYKTFKLPVFGGTVPILFDEDLFSVDVAFSSGLSTEEIKPLSWDESRVLVLSEGRLHFVGRHNYIALFGGVICPYCQAMVYFEYHCPHLTCISENLSGQLYWISNAAKRCFEKVIYDNLSSVEDEQEREELELVLIGQEPSRFLGNEIISKAWKAVSAEITIDSFSEDEWMENGRADVCYRFVPKALEAPN